MEEKRKLKAVLTEEHGIPFHVDLITSSVVFPHVLDANASDHLLRKQKAKERQLWRTGAAQSQRGSQREESSGEKNGSEQEEEAGLQVGHAAASANC